MDHSKNFSDSAPLHWGYKLLLLLSLVLLLCRFVFPGEAPYVSDEPNFQLAVSRFMEEGRIPFTNFRGSSISMPYGAGPIYFYWPIRLLTAHPKAIVIYHIFMVSLSALFLFLALRLKFGTRVAAWALFAASTSPFLFLFSRHTWDSTIFLPVAGFGLYLLAKLESPRLTSLRRNLLLFAFGLAIGYCVVVHLMFGAVALAALFTVLYFCFFTPAGGENFKERFSGLLCFGLGCAIFVLPYLYEAYFVIQTEKPLEASKFKKRWGDARNIWWTFQRTLIHYSVWKSNVYLDGVFPTFLEYAGQPWRFFFKIDIFGWFGKLAAWALPFYVLINLLRKRRQSVLLTFAMFSFFSTVLVLNYVNIPTAMHYYNPVWWLSYVGIAWALSTFSRTPRRVLFVSIVLTGIVNSAFLFYSMKFVHENQGARNVGYATILDGQIAAVKELCREMSNRNWQSVDLDITRVYFHKYPVQYHFTYLDECAGKSVTFGHPGANQCSFELDPASSTSARLTVQCGK